MRTTIKIKVEGINLGAVDTLLNAEDLREVGEAHIAAQLKRVGVGLNAESKPIARGRTGRYIDVTGAWRRSLKVVEANDRVVRVEATVPYAKRVQEIHGATGFTAREAQDAAVMVSQAIGAHIAETEG